jgi:hypothetical protein
LNFKSERKKSKIFAAAAVFRKKYLFLLVVAGSLPASLSKREEIFE